MKIDVLGLGAVCMDIVLNCSHLPDEDGYAVINKESVVPGGSCANVITALSGLGMRAAFVACLGDDDYGRALMADFESRGVNTDYVFVKKHGISMHSYVAVSSSGSKTIFCNMGDSLLSLQEENVHGKMLANTGLFYTAIQPGAAALKLARLSRKKNIPVVCNLQVEPEFLDQCGVPGSWIHEMLTLSSLVITFKKGVQLYTGQKDVRCAANHFFSNYHPEIGLIVTLGKDGALWVNQDGVRHIPAFHVPVKDTTGAGDAFNAGFIRACFFDNADPESAMRFGAACAAVKCTQPGPRLNASRREILDFIRRNTCGVPVCFFKKAPSVP